jgi:phospholipase C
MHPSGRLAVLLFALAPAAVLAAACSTAGSASVPGGGMDASSAETSTEDGGEDGGDAPLLMPPPINRTRSEGELAPARAACFFEAGAWPAQTIGTEYPVGADIPINHVVVIVQENRSFDHYLGRLVAQGYYQPGDFSGGVDYGTDAGAGTGFSHSDQLDGPPPGWFNPDVDGTRVVPHPDDQYCYGVNHGWGDMHAYYDNGRMDRFVIQNDPDGQRSFFYEDDTVIPFYYALANTFSVADHYHCSVMTSTWPNRLFLMAATSFGIGDNSFVTVDTQAHPAPQIFSLLEAGGHTWKDYTDGPHMVQFFPWFGLNRDTRPHYGNVKCDLLTDIENGTLPDVSFVMGDEVTESSDEGPSDLPGIGGALVEQVVRALWASPSWKDTALFILYDENGGLADHVVPAPACEPDKYAPHDGNGNALPGAFDRTGFRVPFILVSPYARAHFVAHSTYDHTSVTRFIEARFGLPALTARDANAAPLMEMFDFEHPPFRSPPTISAHTTVPKAILAQCTQSMAPFGCE